MTDTIMSNGNTGAGVVKIIPLPKGSKDLVLKTQPKMTLNDHVQLIYFSLFDDSEFHKLLDATDDSDAVTGTKYGDNLVAAMKIQEYAAKNGNLYVANKKPHAIHLALNVVLRRYGISRAERRYLLAGEVTDNTNDQSMDPPSADE
jgi:hypothetical protein